MNVFEFRDRLVKDYSSYTRSFIKIADAFGVAAERVTHAHEIDAAIERGFAARGPYFIEVMSSLASVLPGTAAQSAERSGD